MRMSMLQVGMAMTVITAVAVTVVAAATTTMTDPPDFYLRDYVRALDHSNNEVKKCV